MHKNTTYNWQHAYIKHWVQQEADKDTHPISSSAVVKHIMTPKTIGTTINKLSSSETIHYSQCFLASSVHSSLLLYTASVCHSTWLAHAAVVNDDELCNQLQLGQPALIVHTDWRSSAYQKLLHININCSNLSSAPYRTFLNILFWYAPPGVRSTKSRHQSPEWTILSHVNCFIQGEVIGFQVLLDPMDPCSMRASWWSPPVLQGEDVKILASVSYGIRAMWLYREKCRAWTILELLPGCPSHFS